MIIDLGCILQKFPLKISTIIPSFYFDKNAKSRNFQDCSSFQGSNEFVNRFLVPNILRKYGQSDIGGAFIADTLMNLNRTVNSQELPEEWIDIDPYTSNKILNNENRGDFLALFQRRQPDANLVSVFSKHWNYLQNDKSPKDFFKLRPFRIDLGKSTPTIEELTKMVNNKKSKIEKFLVQFLKIPEKKSN